MKDHKTIKLTNQQKALLLAKFNKAISGDVTLKHNPVEDWWVFTFEEVIE